MRVESLMIAARSCSSFSLCSFSYSSAPPPSSSSSLPLSSTISPKCAFDATLKYFIITAESCENVMFSVVSVILCVQGEGSPMWPLAMMHWTLSNRDTPTPRQGLPSPRHVQTCSLLSLYGWHPTRMRFCFFFISKTLAGVAVGRAGSGGGGGDLEPLSECKINFYHVHFFSSFSSSFFASLPRLVLFHPAESSTERSVPEIPSSRASLGSSLTLGLFLIFFALFAYLKRNKNFNVSFFSTKKPDPF